MALLTTGNFYGVVWLPGNDPAWAALSPAPSIPSEVADAIFNATAMVIYVTNSATGSFSFLGGTATGFDDTVVDSSTAAFAELAWTPTGGPAALYGEDPATADIWVYYSASDLIWMFAAVDTTAFKAFLP